ncbi:MAG: DUF1573 domain-containing protein [Bacteroidales bacterium]|nr:DUF1573 domain-containing protein [Bacteroidales bacterium]
MRNILLTFFALTAIMLSNCGNSTRKDAAKNVTQLIDTGNAEIVFKEYEHDFGKVTEGEKLGFTFTFKNKGTGSLVIASATTSCGCTVPKFDSKPIPPDGQGKLEVVFDTSGRNGMQTKTITVKSNATVPVVLLRITAEVVSNNNQ